MEQVRISDITMKGGALSLSFKEKIELSKLLDRLGVSVIELEGIRSAKVDALRIKSVALAVNLYRCARPGLSAPSTTVRTVVRASAIWLARKRLHIRS